MKHKMRVDEPFGNGRPFTGAWIETEKLCRLESFSQRRPFTGAWIETMTTGATTATPVSPLHGGVD